MRNWRAVAVATTLFVGGFLSGAASHRLIANQPTPPVIRIDGPLFAKPGETLRFSGERSSAAKPLEWWVDGQHRGSGNDLQLSGVRPGVLVVNSFGYGQGSWWSLPPHAIATHIVTVEDQNPPGPDPPPPGPTPPPGPPPVPAVRPAHVVVLYSSKSANADLGRIRTNWTLRQNIEDAKMAYSDFDTEDPATRERFRGYFALPDARIPAILLLAPKGTANPMVYSGPLPTNPDDVMALIRRYAP